MSTSIHDLAIGELAESAGLTVRTLHYYEQIGLVTASRRTVAGHRRYDDHDAARLYEVCQLRKLGLPLDQIKASLDDKASDLVSLMTAHLHEVEAQAETTNRLRTRLTRLVEQLTSTTDHDLSEIINVMEDMTMLETTLDKRISILVYEDIAAAHEYLSRVFGLGPGELTMDPDGNVVHGELEAGDGVLWMHPVSPDFKLASPKSIGASTATMAVMVGDVDAHYRHAVSEGATIRYEPVDQPYGYREYSAVDLEGHLWSFMKPLAP